MISVLSSLTAPELAREIHPTAPHQSRAIVEFPNHHPHRHRFTALLRFAAVIIVLLIAAIRPAAADFRLCNNTASRVGISLGYKDSDGGWTTEGWWNLSSRSCETLLKGALVARFYYIYAVDYDHGGDWSGKAYMCTRDKEFTIRGIEDCLARGFDRAGFFEVDTGEQRSWTVQLTETTEQTPQSSLPPYTPVIPPPAVTNGRLPDQLQPQPSPR